MNALKLSALAAVFAAISACSTVEYVPVAPECSPVVMPALPNIDRGELWDALGDEQYRVLERYIDRLWSVVDEQSAIIGEVCGE